MGSVLDTAINETLLTVATTKQMYPLGFIYSSSTNGVDNSVNRYIYVKAVSVAVARGGLYAISRSTSADYTPTTPSANDVNVIYGVGLGAIATSSYGFIQISGNVTALTVAGSTTTAYAVRPTDGAATATSEGTSTVSASTIGIATSTSASSITAFLFGKNIPSATSVISLGQYWKITPSSTELKFEHSTDGFSTIDFTNTIIAE